MSYPQGPLEGRVEYHDNLFSHILHGVAGVLKDVGGAVIEHAPEILQGVATGLAATSLNQSRNIMPDYSSSNLDFGSSSRNSRRISTPNTSTYQPVEIQQYKPSTLGRDALRQVEARRQPYEPPHYTPPKNPLSGLVRQNMGQTAPPQYRPQTPDAEIYHDHQQSNEAFLRALDPNFGLSSSAPIQEGWGQIQGNLAHAQHPVTYQQQVQQVQTQQLAELQRQNQQAQLRLAEEQARTLRRQASAQFNQNSFPQAIHNNRYEGKQDLWSKVHQGDTLSDDEMKQLFHAIDLQKYGASTQAEQRQAEAARLYAEQKLAENMVDHAEQDENGNLYLGGVPVRSEDALYFALEDVRHFQQTDRHLTPKQLIAMNDENNADLNANTAYEFLQNSYKGTSSKPKQTLTVTQNTLPKGVFLPKGVNVNANIAEAQRHYGDLVWFYNQVRNHGPWDYKQQGSKFESFGNFHYGLIGTAMGFPEGLLLRGAGWAQTQAKTSKPSWGDPGVVIFGGTPPYGDDPKDQFWIRAGIQYYQKYKSLL